MTVSRAQKVDLSVTPYYHCMSRCVRRSFLCGVDIETGLDFSHRKSWIEERILYLSTIFAIKVCAYAVMSNHYHTVLFIDRCQANAWDAQEVIERWKKLFPRDADKVTKSHLSEKLKSEKIKQWRERLMDLSWYMRCLNEPIARFANEEDDCTGRFWEGRFKSQALLDEGALLSAMVYVDLNPIRAKQANRPEESEFTSIYERIKAFTKEKTINPQVNINNAKQPSRLMPFSNSEEGDAKPAIEFSLCDYLDLVDETGRIIREDKKGAIPDKLEPILIRLNLTKKGWLNMVSNLEQGFFYAIGSELKLLNFSSRYSCHRAKGMRAARNNYLKVA